MSAMGTFRHFVAMQQREPWVKRTEQDRVEETGHPRSGLDPIDRLDAPDKAQGL